MSEKDFKFYVPVDLSKAEGKDEDDLTSWQIQGIASTGDMDYQGETVDQNGLDLSILKSGKGLFNDNHSNAITDILGQIEEAELVDHNGAKAMFVKGYLFKHQVKAQAYYNVMKSLKKGASHRVHFSIEGKILERDKSDSSKIRKAKISKVALTLDPVNFFSFADLVKSLSSFEETPNANELEKAMEAGTGSLEAPTDRTGGEALTKESLEGAPKNVGSKNSKKKKKINSQMIKSTIATLAQKYPEMDQLELAKAVCKAFENKIKGT